MKALYPLMLLLAATGCQSIPPDSKDRPVHSLPKGTLLTLATPVPIPANSYSVYFQLGQLLAERDIDRWEYHCELEFWHKQPDAYELEDGTFLLENAYRHDYIHAQATLVEVTRLSLSSRDYTDIRKMTCTIYSMIPSVGPISVGEMEKTLGEYFRIRLESS